MYIFNHDTFVKRRLPVDPIDPVLMACQDRLQRHSKFGGHICIRSGQMKIVIKNVNLMLRTSKR